MCKNGVGSFTLMKHYKWHFTHVTRVFPSQSKVMSNRAQREQVLLQAENEPVLALPQQTPRNFSLAWLINLQWNKYYHSMSYVVYVQYFWNLNLLKNCPDKTLITPRTIKDGNKFTDSTAKFISPGLSDRNFFAHWSCPTLLSSCTMLLRVKVILQKLKSIIPKNFTLLQSDPDTGRIISQLSLISFKRDKNTGNI